VNLNLKLLNFETKNYILVGLISFFPSLLFGGLFVLLDGKRSIKHSQLHAKRHLLGLEEKLKTLESLLERRVITKEEYDLKRKDIIIKF
jgi:hypothetical protein